MSLFGKKDYKQLGRQEEAKNNYAQALKYYEKALQNGDASVQIHMGNIYKDGGNGINKDGREALRCYIEGANKGDIFCSLQLAAEYVNGNICNVNVEKALEILLTASEQGDNRAVERLNSLKAMIEDGSLAKKYGDFAIQYYNAKEYECAQSYAEAGGKLGDRNSMTILGAIYKNGKNGETDYDKAVYWCEKAAEVGGAAELYNLAHVYVRYRSDLENVEKALFLVRKAADSGLEKAKAKLEVYEKLYQLFQKASQEDAEAQKELAKRYRRGDPFEKDEKKYIYWIKKSAENGDAEAQSIIEKDLVKFVFYCYQAARQGDVAAMENLALIYKSGVGVHKNIERAIYWYRKAAQAGSEKAQKNLEELYYYDKIIQDAIRGNYAVNTYHGDPDEVIEEIPNLLEEATEGDSDAQYKLISLYNKAGDMQKVEGLWDAIRESAEKGNAGAQMNLALNYAEGDNGLKRNFDAAVMWYKKAAGLGEMKAMYRLAFIYKYSAFYGGYSDENEKEYIKEGNKWAKKALNKYMELWDAGNMKVAGDIGEVYWYLDNKFKAIEWYNEAIAHGFLEANNELAFIYEMEKDYVKAIEYYKKAVDAKDYSHCRKLAEIYREKMKDYESASLYLKMRIVNANADELSCLDYDELSECAPRNERAYWLLKSVDIMDNPRANRRLQNCIEGMKKEDICKF